MLSPPVGPSDEGAREGRQQPVIRHLLQSKDRHPAAAKIDGLKLAAVRAAAGHASAPAQFSRRQQPRVAQPCTGAVRLDYVPDLRITGGKARRTGIHAIPSTSIIE
jgi:hypothetical protein